MKAKKDIKKGTLDRSQGKKEFEILPSVFTRMPAHYDDVQKRNKGFRIEAIDL